MGTDMAGETFSINLFDGRNYDNWKFRLEAVLDEHSLLHLIENDVDVLVAAETDEAKKELLKKSDKKAKSLIIRRIADSHLEYIKDCKSAFQALKALSNVFAKKSISNQLFIRKKLLTLKCEENANLGQFFLQFDGLVRQLISSGAKMEKLDIICHLLITLPDSYNNVITAIETLNPESLEMEFVKNRLLEEERKRNCVNNDDASVENVVMKATFKYKCHYCGKIGHKKKNCFKWKKEQSGKHGNIANSDISFVADEDCFGVGIYNGMKWIVDSGASDHMANDEKYFENLVALKNPVVIGVAKNGVCVQATKMGTIRGLVKVNGTNLKCKLENVLFCKDLSCNLFSIRRIEEAGMKTVFQNKKVNIYRGDYLVLQAERRVKLYEFYLNVHSSASANLTTSQQNNLWHKRLGHLNFNDMKKLYSITNGMQIIEGEKSFCEDCIFGKQSRGPFKAKVNVNKTCRKLQLIHSDVCGPMTPTSWDGKKYIVTFIDDYSHFTSVYMMSNKSETLDKFKEFKSMAENLHGTKIANLRCDNGGEYSSNGFKDFCKKSGILIQYTNAYTPEQNGKSERMNRTLIEKARSLFSASCLPKFLWSEGVYCANYLTNRSPTSSLQYNKTPAEM